MDKIVLLKSAVIERCLNRIEEEYQGDIESFNDNYTKQDSVILNLERLIHAVIDIGAHIVKVKKIGIPQNYREIFDLLQENQIIPSELALNLKKMVGFRNIAIHEYQKLNMDIVHSILKSKLVEITKFKQIALALSNSA